MKEDYEVSNLIFVDDGYEKTLPAESQKDFNKYLPLEKRIILPEIQNGVGNGNFHESVVKLYKCSENNGKYRVVEIKNGPLQQSDLSSDVSSLQSKISTITLIYAFFIFFRTFS